MMAAYGVVAVIVECVCLRVCMYRVSQKKGYPKENNISYTFYELA